MRSKVLKISVGSIKGKNEIRVISLTGVLDTPAINNVEKIIMPLIETGKTIIIDCKDLRYINSTALVAFMKYYSKAKENRAGLKIARLNPIINEMMDISGAKKLLEIFPNINEAVSSIH